MHAIPPLEIMQIAAELPALALDGGHCDAVSERLAASAAHAGLSGFWRDRTTPGNAVVSVLVKTGGVNRPDGPARARVPILAVRPVVDEHHKAANLAEGKDSSGAGFRQMLRLRRLNPQAPQLSGPPLGISQETPFGSCGQQSNTEIQFAAPHCRNPPAGRE